MKTERAWCVWNTCWPLPLPPLLLPPSFLTPGALAFVARALSPELGLWPKEWDVGWWGPWEEGSRAPWAPRCLVSIPPPRLCLFPGWYLLAHSCEVLKSKYWQFCLFRLRQHHCGLCLCPHMAFFPASLCHLLCLSPLRTPVIALGPSTQDGLLILASLTYIRKDTSAK